MQRSLSVSIAIIGSGERAKMYAAKLAIAGHEVYLAHEKVDQSFCTDLATIDNLHCCSIEEASSAADIILIVAAPKYAREISYWLGDVRGKVVVDATANDISSKNDELNTVGAIKAITGSSDVVKIFCTRGYEQMLKPLLKNEKTHFVLISDNAKAKEVVKIISQDLGVTNYIDLGGLDAIGLFDSLVRSWQKLAGDQGKLVRV